MSSISTSDLLANRNPYRMSIFIPIRSVLILIYTVPIGAFDGKVATAIGQFVCTTPNQDQIYLPPTEKRDVFLRSDFRYGPDDHTLWPQPFLIEYPHLGAIPRQPEDPKDPLSIMWWNPSRADFFPLENGVLDGMGQLSTSKYWGFQEMSKDLKERVEKYKKMSTPNSFLSLLVRLMDDSLIRMGSLKSPFGLLWFKIAEFQRLYLETYALLDYLEIYKPRMDGQQPPATTVANCIGAVTNLPHVVQYFHNAGLPIWFLRHWTTGPFPNNVLTVVSPLNPDDSLCVSPRDPPFPVIYRGYLNSKEKHDAIHCYSRKWFVFKDPFRDDPPSKDPEPQRLAAQRASCESILLLLLSFFLTNIFSSVETPNNASYWPQQVFAFKQPSIPLSRSSLECWASGRQSVPFSPRRSHQIIQTFWSLCLPRSWAFCFPS